MMYEIHENNVTFHERSRREREVREVTSTMDFEESSSKAYAYLENLSYIFFGYKPTHRKPQKFKEEGTRYNEDETVDVNVTKRSRMSYFPDVVSTKNDYLQRLIQEIPWIRGTSLIEDSGIVIDQTRSMYYCADNETLTYTYSGKPLEPVYWPDVVYELREIVHKFLRERNLLKRDFNCVLMHYYKDGTEYINFHSDDEDLFGKEPTIAGLSFGASRDFVLRHNETREKWILSTKSGSLYVMAGACQEELKHSVPKRRGKFIGKPRVSLTFRTIVRPEKSD